jgi:hypothetical protein
MSLDQVMYLSLALVALAVLGMAGVVVLLRNLGSNKSAKTNSSADKSVEPKM